MCSDPSAVPREGGKSFLISRLKDSGMNRLQQSKIFFFLWSQAKTYWCTPLTPGLWRERHVTPWECEDTLVCIGSSRVPG